MRLTQRLRDVRNRFVDSFVSWRDRVRLRRLYGQNVTLVNFNESANEGSRWATKRENTRLTVVVAAYHQVTELDCLLKSFACQTLQNFKVIVIHDGQHDETREVVKQNSLKFPGLFEYMETKERHNDYGHSLRSMGIEWAQTEFVMLTNGDNYYAPRFVEFMFEAIDRGSLDVVLCDMVHSHLNPGYSIQRSYRFFRTRPFRHCVDIGSFIAKSEKSKKVGFRDKRADGDATYFEDILGKTGPTTVGKVNKVLMVHN